MSAEPPARGARPKGMDTGLHPRGPIPTTSGPSRLLAVALAAVVAAGVAGCGREPAVPGQAARWGACDLEAFEAAPGPSMRVEVGTQEAPVVLKLAEGEGPCADALVGRFGDGVHGHRVPGPGLDLGTASTVYVGGQAYLLVRGAPHPRGGYQPHLYSLDDGLAEVKVDGRPLLPFVATDGGAAPATARCGSGRTVEVLTATTSKPPGVVLAWDVQRTTYELDGADATRIGSEQIRDHAADPLLRKELPQMFERGAFLEDCRQAPG